MSEVLIYVFSLVAIYAVAAFPLNLMQGYTGLFSVSAGGIFGIGAYVSVIATSKFGIGFAPAILIGAITAGGLQAAIASSFLRLSDIYFLLATLAVQFILESVFASWAEVTGGGAGLYGFPPADLFGLDISTTGRYLGLLAVIAAASFAASYAMAHSWFGLAMRGVRDDSVGVESLGYRVRLIKVGSSVYFGLWAGLAGGLYATLLGTVNPGSFDINRSILMQAFIIVGGAGNLYGSFLGVAILVGIPEYLRYVDIAGPNADLYRDVIYGAILVLVMRFLPSGLLREQPRDAGSLAPRSRKVRFPVSAAIRNGGHAIAASAGATRERPIFLQASGLALRFGGLQALDRADLCIREGVATAIIGPNGAGKSTIFNVISGFLAVNQGTVVLRGEDITTMSVRERLQRGMSRTFQDLRLFETLTVRQNILLAVNERRTDWEAQKTHGDISLNSVDDIIRFFGLAALANRPVKDIGYGNKKLVSVARVVGTGCQLLLLDEPTSGLDANEIADLMAHLRSLINCGYTICIVEHNMDVVVGLVDEVFVMDRGKTILNGSPDQVLKDEQVLDVYLGR